jgi:two-component system response regulator FlrC
MSGEKRVLIVDDDENMRMGMTETVKRMGISVDEAENGKIGFDMAMKKEYDLIISDMRMPEVDGLGMFKMLKTAGINTPVCFVTAYGTVNSAVEALKMGAYDYILKPFSLDVIEELVKRTFHLKRSGFTSRVEHKGAIFRSSYMTKVFAVAADIANSEATVLITGESGTGKEVLARYIHENSNRENNPFITVNCASIPENLIESELFGYEKGAFTGAVNKKPGKFELADGGTLLLDEIGEIPINLQAKLLRVLQEKEIDRLGGTKKQKVNVRIIATTNKNLKEEVESGNFREDLFYRLNVISIELPPLRKRKEDIEMLADFFIKKYSDINNKPVKKLSPDASDTLKNYEWPGNVRELEHTIERAVVLSKTNEITSKDLFIHGITFRDTEESFLKTPDENIQDNYKDEPITHSDILKGRTIADVEKELILNTLKETNGNRTKAAEILGITSRTLRNKLNEYKENGINIEDYT